MKLYRALIGVSLSLVISQQVFAQNGKGRNGNEDFADQARSYGQFLHNTKRMFVQLKSFCKYSDTPVSCNALADRAVQQTNETLAKRHVGLFVKQEQNEFHDRLLGDLTKLTLMINYTPEFKAAAKRLREAARPRPKPTKFRNMAFHPQVTPRTETAECEMCGWVYEHATAICALYLGWSTPSAAVCMIAATAGYVRCYNQWCRGYVMEDSFNTDFFDDASNTSGSCGGDAVDDDTNTGTGEPARTCGL